MQATCALLPGSSAASACEPPAASGLHASSIGHSATERLAALVPTGVGITSVRSFGPALLDQALYLLDVLFGLGLAFQAPGGHVANLAEDSPLLPAPVVLAEGPRDVCVGVGIPAIHEVLVVEVERRLVGLLWGLAPLQDLLPPIHPHVVVHVARVTHLVHRRVPVLVVGFGVFKLLAGVEIFALVVFVLLKGLSGPVRQTGELVVVGDVMAKVHRKLAAYDQLFEVRVEVFLWRAGVLDLQRHVYGRDVAVVQVLAHVRDVVGLGLVAVLDVGTESTLQEMF